MKDIVEVLNDDGWETVEGIDKVMDALDFNRAREALRKAGVKGPVLIETPKGTYTVNGFRI